jgi:hypothetical protein
MALPSAMPVRTIVFDRRCVESGTSTCGVKLSTRKSRLSVPRLPTPTMVVGRSLG